MKAVLSIFRGDRLKIDEVVLAENPDEMQALETVTGCSFQMVSMLVFAIGPRDSPPFSLLGLEAVLPPKRWNGWYVRITPK